MQLMRGMTLTGRGFSCLRLSLGAIRNEKLGFTCQITWSVPVLASCMTFEMLGLVPQSLHRLLCCTDGKSVIRLGHDAPSEPVVQCHLQGLVKHYACSKLL